VILEKACHFIPPIGLLPRGVSNQLQLNPVDYPIEIRLFGRADISPLQEEEDIRALRTLAEQVKAIFRPLPEDDRVRDDWDEETMVLRLPIDPIGPI